MMPLIGSVISNFLFLFFIILTFLSIINFGCLVFNQFLLIFNQTWRWLAFLYTQPSLLTPMVDAFRLRLLPVQRSAATSLMWDVILDEWTRVRLGLKVERIDATLGMRRWRHCAHTDNEAWLGRWSAAALLYPHSQWRLVTMKVRLGLRSGYFQTSKPRLHCKHYT